jgi:hypothetical protein
VLKAVVDSCACGRDGSEGLTDGASPGRQVFDLIVQRSLGGIRRAVALPIGGVCDGGSHLWLVLGNAVEAAFPKMDVAVTLMVSCILMVHE